MTPTKTADRVKPVIKGPPLPRSRRPGGLLAALSVIAAGVLLSYWVFTQLDHRTAALMLTRDVPIGAQITADALTSVPISADSAVATIPASQLDAVVGKSAAVDLRPGTLLAASQLTGALTPAAGQVLVPVALKPAQIPARGLHPGDQVLVIAGVAGTAPEQVDTGKPAKIGDVPAVVDQVGEADADGLRVVDLLLHAEHGDAVAGQAQAGTLALVLTPRRP